ncbi:MAG: hypothetical protein PHC29_07210 [Candidatus Omnitrophica bacterium]|nr:hypothetical protein [Candidatus Omnitrophota bacterium]
MPSLKKKRILGIWDFKALPWSIGDPLVFIEKLSTLKIKYDAEEVDICIIYDRDDPDGNRKPGGIHKFVSSLTSENSQDYMLEFLPLFGTCPFLGSVFQFSKREEFHIFLKNNPERYILYPSLGQHLAETYNFRGGEPHNNEFQEFHKVRGFIPYLRVGERDVSWAKWFYQNYLPSNTFAVTFSLKRTTHDTQRNADPSVWFSFLDKCKVKFPEIVFIFIGLREEAFDGLRERSNVIIAKDYGTSIMEDLALIRASLMYMATISGVTTIALYSDLPYLFFQLPNIRRYGFETGKNFSFATDKQKIFSVETKVTPEFLLQEFRDLYSKLDKDKWRKLTVEHARNKCGHPTAKGL